MKMETSAKRIKFMVLSNTADLLKDQGKKRRRSELSRGFLTMKFLKGQVLIPIQLVFVVLTFKMKQRITYKYKRPATESCESNYYFKSPACEVTFP